MSVCPKCGFDTKLKATKTWAHKVKAYAPSLNKIGVNNKLNHTYRNWRKNWAKQFGDWLKSIPVATNKRRVQITRMFGKNERAYDRQNFASGCKPLLDVIVEYGAIYDDSPNWCDDYYDQLKSEDGKDYVVVTIEEL